MVRRSFHSLALALALALPAGAAFAAPPADLDWDAFLGPAPARKYNPNRGLYHFRWFWDYSGGQMTNLGHHSLDVVDWFLVNSLRDLASSLR